jgi:hypothetical protein
MAINTPSGTTVVDSSVIPYIRANEVELVSTNLKPNSYSYLFFDRTNINGFTQKTSVLNVSSITAISLSQGDGLYCKNTHAYATVVTTSPNNVIYLNENYVTFNLAPVGANVVWSSSNTSDYIPGEVIFQIINPSVNGYSSLNSTFMGRVEYWNPADASLTVSVISGTALTNASAVSSTNTNVAIYKLSDRSIAYCLGIVGDSGTDTPKFAAGNTVINTSIATPNTVTVSSNTTPYIPYSGQFLRANTADATNTKLILSSNDPGIWTGLYLSVIAGTGIGQSARILSTNNNTITVDTAIPVDGTSRWSIGYHQVDNNSVLAGIFHIPENATTSFLSGQRAVTITDTPNIDDPSGTMRSQAYYTSSGSVWNTSNFRGTPVIPPPPILPPGAAPVSPVNPSLRGSVTTPNSLVANTTYGSGTAYSDSDPLAQTFFTPDPKSIKQNYGIFVTSVDLWFKNKPTANSSQLPVLVSIVETNNGFPTSSILASTYLHCAEINISNVPDSANIGSLIANNTTSTRFTFDDPVYLQPSTEYALVIHTDSPDYQSFISDIGSYDISFAGASANLTVGGTTSVNSLYTYLTQAEAFQVSNTLLFGAAKGAPNAAARDAAVQTALNSYRIANPGAALNASQADITYYAVDPANGNAYQMTNVVGNGVGSTSQSKVSMPPNIGSLYLAQNSSTWTPLKNQMLMFVLNKAVFETNPVSLNFNITAPQTLIAADAVTLYADDVSFPTCNITYAMQTTYSDINGGGFILNPTATIIQPLSRYGFGQDLAIGSLSDNREKYILPGNANSFLTTVTLQTTDPDVSPVFNTERLSSVITTNIVNPGAINPKDTAIINSVNVQSVVSTTYNVATFVVTIDPPQSPLGNIQAIANISTRNMTTDGYITGINILNPGAGYIGNTNITIKSNTGTVLANAVIASETGKFGGNSLTRYQTQQIVLAQGFNAGDLRVFVDGIIPVGTAVQAYYKVQSAQDSDFFYNKSWQLMAQVNNINSPDQITPIEIQFAPAPLIGGIPTGTLSYIENGIVYPLGGTFNTFAIKLTLLALDPTVVPVVTGLRVIALPSG